MNKKLLCLECNKEVANTNNVLARHLRAVHDTEWVDYVVKHEYGNSWPLCECNCGEKLAWRKGGFTKFIKGHDNQGIQNTSAQRRITNDKLEAYIRDDYTTGAWAPNPWTGQEELFRTETEHRFLLWCASVEDPITKDHGIKIGWEDSSGKLQIYTPSFKHLQKSLIIDLGGFSGSDGGLRLSGIKEWCDMHKMLMISLRHIKSFDFEVITWYKPFNIVVDS